MYEKAIRSAHANGFIHNEAVAYEVAARFYAARGFEKIADTYLREARYCYHLSGADGKVRQLDHFYPHLRKEEPSRGTIIASHGGGACGPPRILDSAQRFTSLYLSMPLHMTEGQE
jgi:GAF domain-containing protein